MDELTEFHSWWDKQTIDDSVASKIGLQSICRRAWRVAHSAGRVAAEQSFTDLFVKWKEDQSQ